MKLFRSATTKLTLSYLAIVMLISISFSVVLYQISAGEIGHKLPQGGFIVEGINPEKFAAVRQALVDESDMRLKRNLILVNLAMLVVGGGISYWLARRTLGPIEEAMEAQGRFVSDASHELRTPLAAMQSEIEVALRDKKLSSSRLQKLVKSNLEEVSKLRDLSDHLLQLTNGRDIPMIDISLETAAIEATNRVLQRARDKSITIENNVGRLQVHGNLESLTDLLAILLDNAVKYSPPNTNITTSSDTQSKDAVITVQDQGNGIKASDLPHIFDRFYRADVSRSKNQVAGYGLGLSIAKKIVDLHGGTIQVQSTPGKGTTFIIRLPLS